MACNNDGRGRFDNAPPLGYPSEATRKQRWMMTASSDRKTGTEAPSISGESCRREWTAPSVRRLAAGSAEAGGKTIPDGQFGFS